MATETERQQLERLRKEQGSLPQGASARQRLNELRQIQGPIVGDEASRLNLARTAGRQAAEGSSFPMVALQAFARQFPGFQNLVSGSLGLADRAGLIGDFGADLTEDERDAAVQAFTETMKSESLPANIVGTVGGFLGGGRLIGGAARALERVPGVIGAAARSLTPVRGETLNNIGRRAVGGQIVGGIAGGLEEGGEGILPGAIAGGLVGPAAPLAVAGVARGASALGSGAARLGRAARNVVSPGRQAPSGTPGARTSERNFLARTVGDTPEALEARASEFTETFNRRPSLAEISSPSFNRELQILGQRSRTTEATTTLSEAAQKSLQELPRDVSRSLQGRNKVFTPKSVREFRDRRADQEFEKLKPVQIELSQSLKDLLRNKDLINSITKPVRNRTGLIIQTSDQIKKEIRNVLRGKQPLTGGLVNSIRKTTNMADFRRSILDLAAEGTPQLRRPVKQYARLSTIAEGIENAPKVFRSGTREFATDLGLSSRAARFGIVQGIRNNLIRQVEGSGTQSGKASRAFVDNPNAIDKVLLAFGPAEQSRIVRALGIASRQATNVGNLAKLRSASPTERQAALARDVIDLFASSQAGGAFRANLAERFTQALRLSPKTAQRLAELSTDPNRLGEVIAILRERKLPSEDIVRLFQDAFAVQAGQEILQ